MRDGRDHEWDALLRETALALFPEAAFVVVLSSALTNRRLPYFLLFWPARFVSAKVRQDVETVWQEIDALPRDLCWAFQALRYHCLMSIALQSALLGRLLARKIDGDGKDQDRGGDSLFRRAATFQIELESPKSPARRLVAEAA